MQNELSLWRYDFTMASFYPDTDLQSNIYENNICVLLSYGYRCRIWFLLWLLTTEKVDCRTDKQRRLPRTRFHFGNKQSNSHLWHV
jgi:hypothetical protein